MNPRDFKTKPWLRSRQPAITTRPTVLSVSTPSSRLPGGDTVTITGTNFRLSATGAAPLVFFGASVGTGVVLLSSTSLTVIVPAGVVVGAGLEAGIVDISVQVDSEIGTLYGGFLYYTGTILSVTPNFTIVTSGPQINVLIKGYNFLFGSNFTFDGILATNVTFIDDTQYSVTVPEHAEGTVDVVMIETGGTFTLRNGFKYASLTAGSDIRRLPSVGVNSVLGGSPNTCSFLIDGRSHRPSVGEEIHIVDEMDGDRTLFRGCILTVEQTYEGQISQLFWSCSAEDFTYLLNRRRPFGSYVNVSASEIVLDLMHKYADADFGTSFVQTKLALVTINFDGTMTMSRAFDTLAQAIGGGRWYVDYDRVLHFFHPKVTTDIILPVSLPPGPDFTAPVLSVGASIGSLTPFDPAYYAVRCTFIYSNGAESRLGPASNIIGYGGTKYIHIGSLPIGLNPSGSITCVGRKIYYLKGSDELASGWTVNDNSTTDIDVYPGVPDTPTVEDNDGDPVTIPDAGGTNTSGTGVTSTPPPGPSGPPGTTSISGSGALVHIGGKYPAGATEPQNAFVLLGGASFGAVYAFTMSAVYPTGAESLQSELSAGHTWGPIPVGATTGFVYSTGPASQMEFLTRGFDIWISQIPSFPSIGTMKPYKIRVYAHFISNLGTGTGGVGVDPTFDFHPSFIGEIPYFEETQADGTPIDPVTLQPIDTSVPISNPATTSPTGGLGNQPVVDPASTDPTLIWPNPDGPYLENFDPPDDIDDDNMDLLHEDSGSQKFASDDDVIQLRNRVRVFGAGTTTTADVGVGSPTVPIADPSIFSLGGGQVLAGNGLTLGFFSVSSLVAGSANLLLSAPLAAPIPAGTVIQYYCQVDDVASQRERGSIELTKLSAQTDGIHEYVIVDTSLKSIQEVYLRAHAEIQVYSKPIRTIKYATRDAKTRPGAIVHVDLTNPPCQGDFLIQTVDIDQVHDESDQIGPRYTVMASSLRYDLTNFLLTLLSGPGQSSGGVGGSSSIGLVAAATTQAAEENAGSTDIVSLLRRGFTYSFVHANNTLATVGATANPPSLLGTASVVTDNRGVWQRTVCTATIGQFAGYQQSSMQLWTQHESVIETYFRTGPSITDLRLWIVFTVGAKPGNTDVPSTVSFGAHYYSNGVTGGAIQLYTQAVAGASGSFLRGGAFPALEPNQEYGVRLAVENAGANMTCQLYSLSFETQVISMALPASIMSLNFFPTLFLNTTVNVAKQIEFLRIGLQSGLLL